MIYLHLRIVVVVPNGQAQSTKCSRDGSLRGAEAPGFGIRLRRYPASGFQTSRPCYHHREGTLEGCRATSCSQAHSQGHIRPESPDDAKAREYGLVRHPRYLHPSILADQCSPGCKMMLLCRPSRLQLPGSEPLHLLTSTIRSTSHPVSTMASIESLRSPTAISIVTLPPQSITRFCSSTKLLRPPPGRSLQGCEEASYGLRGAN
jgi:hypothetical protein